MFKNLNRRKKGQSTLEYIILVTGVVVILILFLKKDGPFQTAYNSTLSTGTDGMNNMANFLRSSR